MPVTKRKKNPVAQRDAMPFAFMTGDSPSGKTLGEPIH